MGAWLQQFWAGLSGDFLDLPDGTQAGQVVGRILVAAFLGALLGYERERHGKSAGVRTHTLVSVAAAVFVIVPLHAGVSQNDLTRVIQGVAAGVGFLGAGTIIKENEQGVIHGLTTAAGIFFTTAVGVAAGLGRDVTAVLCAALALVVLALFPKAQQWLERRLGVKPAEPKSVLLPPDVSLKPPSADR